MTSSRSLALLAAALLAAPAFGQGIVAPYQPPPIPIAGPQMYFPTGLYTQPTIPMFGAASAVVRPVFASPLGFGGYYGVYPGFFGGYSYPSYYPSLSGGGYYADNNYSGSYLNGYYPLGGFAPQAYAFPTVVATAPAVEGAGGTPAPATRTPNLPAEFTIELPAAADVWLNGKKLDGQEKERTLTSPALAPGETHTFDVKARWTTDGQKYEWTRTVTLGSGDRSRATVSRGFKVTE